MSPGSTHCDLSMAGPDFASYSLEVAITSIQNNLELEKRSFGISLVGCSSTDQLHREESKIGDLIVDNQEQFSMRTNSLSLQKNYEAVDNIMRGARAQKNLPQFRKKFFKASIEEKNCVPTAAPPDRKQ
uniref:Uncharacterized protein n=1 Tax=Romanomermis culicivorax TaxID=13658 RepID=A0A915K2J6_ROMCU